MQLSAARGYEEVSPELLDLPDLDCCFLRFALLPAFERIRDGQITSHPGGSDATPLPALSPEKPLWCPVPEIAGTPPISLPPNRVVFVVVREKSSREDQVALILRWPVLQVQPAFSRQIEDRSRQEGLVLLQAFMRE